MANNNVLYYEPNETASLSLRNKDGQFGIVRQAPPMEDYCVVVDLQVEVPKRPKCASVTTGDTVLYVRYSSAKDGDARISFNKGTTFEGSQNSYMTSLPTELGTFLDIDSTRASGTNSEMFGINSIDIEYNQYMVPVVTIRFTDIRGMSLFGSEDLRHNRTVGGIDNSANAEIAGSFFKCFFTFPYPRFKIIVKGFYGQPIAYELTCSDFRASFEASTGNFGATAKFIGYTFSVLNDLTLSSLLATSNSQYFGGSYWANHPDKFVFSDGTLMPTFMQLMVNVGQMSKKLGKTEESGELIDIQNKSTKLSNVQNALDAYYGTLVAYLANKLHKTSGSRNIYGDFSESVEGLAKVTVPRDVTNAYNLLKDALNSFYDTNVPKPTAYGETKQPNDFKNESDYSKYSNCYSFLGNELQDYLTRNMTKVAQDLVVKQKEVADATNESITKLIGFKPTVKNVTELILAHVDTLVNEIYACAEEVHNGYDTSATYRVDEVDGTRTYCAFPSVTKTVVDNGVTKEEQAWIGELDANAPEAKLVDSLLRATHDIEDITEKAAANVESSEFDGSKALGMNVTVPLIPSDILGTSNPYEGMDIDYIDDFCGTVALRGFIVCSTLYTLPNFAKECGYCDAKNFLKVFPNVSDSFKKKVGDNGIISPKTLFNHLWELNNKANSLTDEDSIWNTNNYKYNHLLSNKGGSAYPSEYFQDTNKRMMLPLTHPKWSEFHDTVLSSNGNVGDMQVITQGVDGINKNVFYVDLDIEKYKNYKSNSGYDNVDELFDNLTFDSEEMQGFYENTLNENKTLLCYKASSDGYKGSYQDSMVNSLVGIVGNSGESNKLFAYSIGGYKDGYLYEDTSIFGQEDYYENIKNGNKTLAMLFLNTFDWDYKKFSDFLKGQSNYMYFPYLMLLAIGGYYYRKNKSIAFYDGLDFKYGWRKTKYRIHSGTYSMDSLYDADDATQQTLMKMFEEWAEGDFVTLVRNEFEITVKEKFAPNEERVDAEDIILFAKYNSADDFKNFMNKNCSSRFGKNYKTVNIVKKTKDVSLKLIMNEESEAVSTLTRMILQPCMVVKGKKYIGGTSKISSVSQGILQSYFGGFLDGINDGANVQTNGDIASNAVNEFKTNEKLKIALYNYLKIIWDKWLSGRPKNGVQTAWNLEILKDRWHYLDSFFNKLDDRSTINVFDLVSDVRNSLAKQGYSALSLMQMTYGRNKYLLMCNQSFQSMIDPELMKDMFKPIPFKSIDFSNVSDVPDFIVMYTNEPSKYLNIENGPTKDDSYMIGGDDQQLPRQITTKVDGRGYKIPAFGVTYGGQYQSYFSDVQVSMENPQVTEQSLMAQFQIAQSALGGENGQDYYAVGQDLFTIYSNISYTCTVTMMGCAWVQPLMYFQLNNVPMFKGTYLIQKVKHSIEPGRMTTVIVGTRMAKTSTPLVENGLILKNNTQSGLSASSWIETENHNAQLSNDCRYKFFNPLSDSDGCGMTSSDLESTVDDYGKNHGGWRYSIGWGGKKVYELLAGVIDNEARNQDELGKQLVCTVLFNRYKAYGSNLTAMFYNSKQHDTTECTPSASSIAIAKDIFTNTPSVLVGKKTYVKNRVPIWKGGKNTKTESSSLTLTLHQLKSIDSYCTTNGYNTNYHNPRTDKDKKTLEPIPTSTYIPSWHKGEYMLQHDSVNAYGHVFCSVGVNSYKSGAEYWKNESKKGKNSSSNPSVAARQLFNAIKQTVDYSDSITLKDLSMSADKKGNADTVYITCSPTSGMSQVFDIVLNTYSDYVSELYWVVKQSGSEEPTRIQLRADSTSADKVFAVAKTDSSKRNGVQVLNQCDGLNEDFLRSLKKMYGDLSSKETLFKSECRNFSSLTSKDNWVSEAKKILDVNVTECGMQANSLLDGSDVFSWKGSDSLQNTASPMSASGTYNPIGAASYARSHSLAKSQHKCAAYVRDAIINGGKLNLQSYPISACRYVQHLPKWGFKVVHSGVAGDNFSDFKEGDISVIAGTQNGPTSVHGHIQIYSSDGGWYSDYRDTKAWCYNSPKGRPYVVFRFGS